MKTTVGNRLAGWLRCIGLLLVFVAAGWFLPLDEAHALRLDIMHDSGTSIPGDSNTNLSSGNNSDPGSPANFKYVTLFSESQPNESNTELRESYSTKNTWYSFANVYYIPSFTSAAQIQANATGSFDLKTANKNDQFEFELWHYSSAGSKVAKLGNTVVKNGTTSTSTVSVSFSNAAYTLPAGDLLMLQIRFNPTANSDRGEIYCNKNNHSYITVGIQFKIVSSAGVNGSITGPATTPGTALVDYLSTPVYTITANGSYNIQGLQVDGSSVPGAVGLTSYPYTFSAITHDRTISTVFQFTTDSMTIAPGNGGGIDLGPPAAPTPPYKWPGGSTYTYTFSPPGIKSYIIIPNSGYGIEWVHLTNNAGTAIDQAVPLGQTTNFSLNADSLLYTALTASFLPYYTVTSSAGTGGSISPAGSTPVLSGGSLTFAITPDPAYRILAITDNTVNVGNTTPYTITNITSTHNVVATFLPIYTISATAGPNGSISPIGNVSVDSGTNLHFSIIPYLGYRVLDVLVDGTSVGSMTAYTFTNVTANHTISVTFVAAPLASTYCAIPPFISTPAPANVMLILSVEAPMSGPANPTVDCPPGNTPASFTYTCNSSGLSAYSDSMEYYGYFDNNKCYTYSGSGATGLFSPSGAAVGTYRHQCAAGTAWSGNMLNWSTTMAVDAFRKAYTGGNRAVDTTTGTVILAAINNNQWAITPPALSNAELYMPVSGTNQTRMIVRQNTGSGFVLCPNSSTCNAGYSGSGEAQWPTTSTTGASVYSLRIKACDPTGGVETRCNSTTNKPEGIIQKYMDRMRFALMSYTSDNNQNRDGGILREKMKWAGPLIPNGLLYHNASNAVVTCSTSAGCANPEKEVNTDGTFVNNPDAASSGNSGVINYINKFAYTSGYKNYDPSGELYYQAVRYFKNLTPSVNNYCAGITEPNDGFAVYCNASKTDARGWRDPTLYSCSQNFIVGVNDANPWLDKRIPGGPFKANYGGSAAGGTDWCGSSAGACDTDFTDAGVQVNVENWTNLVGDYEGFTGKTINVACEVNASGVCIGGFNGGGKNVVVQKLGRIIGTPPYPGKENSYLIAGLAYYAHMTDLRPDLSGGNHNITTFFLDTQEPQNNMLVGPRNMLWLAAKYGGFTDIDKDGKPYNGPTCGVGSASPNSLCAEWDSKNVGTPDNYFFANNGSMVEAGLNYAFDKITNTSSSGTAAAVANNKSGERGANIIQALFYPQWKNDRNIKWLGEVQALWYYLDPIIGNSNILEDSDGNKELDLTKDGTPGSDPYAVKALWKAGVELQKHDASTRKIYTLLDPTIPDLTNSANAFTATQMTTLRPLLNSASLSDTDATTLINYIRGVDSGSYRSRIVTNGTVTAEWKLGDIINSTPQVVSAVPINAYDTAYSDLSYKHFISTTAYKTRNVVFAGSNDGMMHAFRLGQVQKINDPANPFRIAGIVDDTGLGTEEWAFIPKNVLPYLPNFCSTSYCHQYYVDGAPLVVDASINKTTLTPACSAANYWECPTQNSDGTFPDVWRTVFIGSMGLGGASRDISGNCNETLGHTATDPNHNATPDLSGNTDCVKSPVSGSGLSSYFALDVTDPLAPKSMWELSDTDLPAADKGLGFTTPGAAIVRINAKDNAGRTIKNTNGRWFAVMASGPTGSIDTATRQFMGRSDQNLKLYVVDINGGSTFTKCTSAGQTGCNYWVIDTGINFAFANSLSGAAIDVDRWNSTLNGYYSDDVVYITYTTALASADWAATPAPPAARATYPTVWDKGGVLRLVTNNDPEPANWKWSFLMKDTGPITTSIGKLQDRTNQKLWVFFGEGRYFYQGDALNTSQRIYGVADPCYATDNSMNVVTSNNSANCPGVTLANLKDQSTDANAKTALGNTDKGWYINLDTGPVTKSDGKVYGAERVVSDVTAAFNGIVFYTTFIPSTDICVSGGSTSLWAVKYNTGGTPPSGGLKGKAPIQTSTGGAPTMIDLASSFNERGNRKLGFQYSPTGIAAKGRFPPLLQPRPMKQILNIQER
jgi:hypothetical protein